MSTEITTVRNQLQQMQPEIRNVLPEHVTIERFQRVTLTALQRQPDLLKANRRSLFGAVMQCAQDGLQPDGREAALVKFKNDAAYMPMVAGLLKLARQSGEISSLAAQVVYDADKFDYWIDEHGEHLTHKPEMTGDQGKPIAVYAMARTKDGEAIIEVMRVAEVEKIRKASRAANAGPWKDWWSEMARKTAIRRLFKRLPRSTDRLESAVHRDDQFYPFKERDAVTAAESVPAASQSLEAFAVEDEPEPVEPEPQPASDKKGSKKQKAETVPAETVEAETVEAETVDPETGEIIDAETVDDETATSEQTDEPEEEGVF